MLERLKRRKPKRLWCTMFGDHTYECTGSKRVGTYYVDYYKCINCKHETVIWNKVPGIA